MSSCKKHGGYSDYHITGHLVGQKVACYDCWLQKEKSEGGLWKILASPDVSQTSDDDQKKKGK